MTGSAILQSPLTGLILAGGRSSRMGFDKAGAPLGGATLLDHVVSRLTSQVDEIVLNAGDRLRANNFVPLRHVPDLRAGQQGPLEGVLAGLADMKARHSDRTHLLSVPCDSPFLPLDLALRLHDEAGQETIVAASSAGRLHPVFALWPTAISADLQTWTADPENRRLQVFMRRHRLVIVDFPLIDTPAGPLDPFLNINTPEDLVMAERFADTLTRDLPA